MLQLIILFMLIIVNAFFAASEIALISLNDNKVKQMAESGHRRAKLVHHLLKEPSRFLATIQIGITLAGFMASAFAAESFAGQLAALLEKQGVPLAASTLESLSVVLITIILSYFSLVFGELVPKRLAMQKAESISMFVAIPLTVLAKISSPFVKFLTASTNGVVRLFGVDPNKEDDNVTEEEIRLMLDVGEENGTIQETEKMMINNIFEFDNKLVSEIMTHRTDIAALHVQTTLTEVLHFINEEKYTRMPVYEKDIDHIIGVLHLKDVLPYLEGDKAATFSMRAILRPAYVALESRRTDDLFQDMQKNKVQLAVIVDEYGGTAGIVTVEDLLEEIVGNIFDEHDDEEDEYTQLANGDYMMSGKMGLDDVSEQIGIELLDEEFDTISGFIIGQLGRIPNVGEKAVVVYNGFRFQAEHVSAKRIEKVRVSPVIVDEPISEQA